MQSRELLQLKEALSRRYAELVYTGLWFNDLRECLQGFVTQTRRPSVTGEVRVQLYKGTCRVVGRRSANSLYDGRLANQANLEWFDGRWSELAQGFTSLWTLPSRLRRPPAAGGVADARRLGGALKPTGCNPWASRNPPLQP